MEMNSVPEVNIGENLRLVRERIASACARSGRRAEDVTLVAVSKLKPFGDILAARACGVSDFGENYVQELTGKMEQAESCGGDPFRWHMIGHLQKNKVKYLIGRTALIHSVDSLSLAEQIEKEAAKKDLQVKILLEVNAAREESKWGFAPEETAEAAEQVSALPHLRLLGLMTSAPLTEDPESNRPYFRALSALARQLSEGRLLVPDPEFRCPVLSMGMTGDFETAVEEGATIVRIGTAVFGKRNYL